MKALMGTAVGLSLPFFGIKNSSKNTNNISVKINPLAVKREKKNSKNGWRKIK